MPILTWLNTPHLPRRTVRLRLTLLYSALFLVSGAVLLTMAYLLATNRIFGRDPVIMRAPIGDALSPARDPHGIPVQYTHRGPALPMPELLVVCGITLAIMQVISVALGWLMAGRVLRPLRTITASTLQISEHNLRERLGMHGPDDELKDLADTIDGLLARLDNAFDAQKDALDAQRSFVANASHELRRPLTLERAALEITLADRTPTNESLQSTCERVLAITKQQEMLIDALLTLAHGQQGLEQYEPFDLAAITDEVLLAKQAEIRRRGLQVHSSIRPALAVGDVRLAERLVTNLVDNAIRHNLPAGRIHVTTGTDDERSTLSVMNTGPSVPPLEVDRLLRPFQRLGADRTNHDDGHGLGLSIVAAIATAHNAQLDVHPRSTGGLDVEVQFSQHPAPRPPAR